MTSGWGGLLLSQGFFTMALTAHTTAYTGDINDWALETHTFGPFAAGALTSSASVPLMILPEACDIEKITLRCTTPAGAGSVTFKVAASGTAAASATAITAAETITATEIAAEVVKDVDFLATNVQTGLASGTLVLVTGAASVTSLVGLMIQITTRKTPTRRDTSTNAQKVDKSRYFYTTKL